LQPATIADNGRARNSSRRVGVAPPAHPPAAAQTTNARRLRSRRAS
jgi:hypothetical protein